MKKQNKGITLIALVITIIVLLILAGVSIATFTGENGILTQAEDAKTKTTQAEARERVQLEIAASFDNKGKYDLEIAKKNLEDNLKLVKDAEKNGYIEDSNGRLTIKYNGYEIYVDEKGKVGDEKFKPTFNAEELAIGAPVQETTSKYGWKVKDYTVKTEDCPSGVWRLFYQDSNYTYLINDELTATTYKPVDYYDTIKDENGELKYQTGADVSTVGQKLSPKISSLFTEINKNTSIRFTAWMTDPEVWKDYKDENGDAVFAIGSPTAELFVASYNNTGKTNTINLGLGTYGYTENTGSKWLKAEDNKGIYNKDDSSHWWLASPYHISSSYGLYVNGGYGFFSNYNVDSVSNAVRPLVCIPTSVFNSDYFDSVVNE